MLSVRKEEIPKSYGGDSDIAEGEWELELCIKANLAGTILLDYGMPSVIGSTETALTESENGAAIRELRPEAEKQGCGEVPSKTNHGQNGSEQTGEKEGADMGAAAAAVSL